MITKNTVLILGAGASMPFGFPSGEGLVEHICTKLTGSNRQAINSALWPLQLQGSAFDKFIETLSRSGRFSIDAFLQHNPQYLEIGKLAIAAALIPFESEQRLFQGINWYKTLFHHLNTSFDEFSQNKLSVITFNYDRSLEWFLLTALQNAYPAKTYEVCRQQLESIPIIHLHGSLGNIPTTKEDSSSEVRQYSTEITDRDLEAATQGIRVIHENIADDPGFKIAARLILESEVIAFLGFGYDEITLQRMGVQNLALTDATCTPTSGQKREWYGTAYGLGAAKTTWISSFLFNQLHTVNARIDECLKEYPILLRPFTIEQFHRTRVRQTLGQHS